MAEKIANLKDKKDQRRRVKVPNGVDANGKTKYKYLTVRSDKPSERKAVIRDYKEKQQSEQADTEKAFSKAAANDGILFKDYAIAFYERYKKPNLEEASRVNYVTALKIHLFPYLGTIPLNLLTVDNLQDCVTTMGEYSRSHIAKVTIVMKEVVENAVADGLANPLLPMQIKRKLKPPKGVINEPRRALTPAEVDAAAKVGYNHPDGLFLLVLYNLGLCRGEALGLKWSDVLWEKNRVRVARDIDYKKGTTEFITFDDSPIQRPIPKKGEPRSDKIGKLKRDARYRLVPIFNMEFRRFLWEHRGNPDDFIFIGKESGYALSEASYKRMWWRLMKAMYLTNPKIEHEDAKPPTKKGTQMSILTPHYFRHNFATLLYWGKVPELQAIKWMGHSSPDMIRKVYAHCRSEDTAQEEKRFAEYFNNTAVLPNKKDEATLSEELA